MRSDIEKLNRLVITLLEDGPTAPEIVREALDELGEARAVEMLITLLRASRPAARRTAARALGALGNSQAIPALIVTLDDESAHVRAAAQEALQRIDGLVLEHHRPQLRENSLLDSLIHSQTNDGLPAAIPTVVLDRGDGDVEKHRSLEQPQQGHPSAVPVSMQATLVAGDATNASVPTTRRRGCWLLIAGAVVLVGVIIAATAVWQRVNAPSPGIGVPVTDEHWEITVQNVRRETRLGNWSNYFTAKSGYAFLVVDMKFRNRELFQKSRTFLPGDLKLIADDRAVFTPDVVGFSFVGEKREYAALQGLEFLMFGGKIIYDKSGAFTVPSDGLELSFVFVVQEEGIHSAFKLQFQDLPSIPFSVGSQPGQSPSFDEYDSET